MEGEEEKERKQFFVVDRSFHISALSEARFQAESLREHDARRAFDKAV